MKKSVLFVFSCLLTLVVAGAEVSVTNLQVRQRWPWSRMIDVTYDVVSPIGAGADILKFELVTGGKPMEIPAEAISGKFFDVVGTGRITIDPLKTQYTNEEAISISARMSVAPAPLYVVYDLTKEIGEVGQVEYVYDGDPRLETSGRFKNIWLSVADDPIYATEKLVMRRCFEGSVHTGNNNDLTNPETPATGRPITMCKPFYMSVFVLTEGQYSHVMGLSASASTRPKDYLSYNQCRGVRENSDGSGAEVNWPITQGLVGYEDVTEAGNWTKSVCLRLRELTGNDTFDLPTEGQWEYACRAGTETYFNSGVKIEDAGSVDAVVASLAWVQGHPASWSTDRVHNVGLLQPNNWGLFDMHGNVFEMCRDVWKNNVWPQGEDPAGPEGAVGSNRIRRGGNFGVMATWATSSYRMSWDPSKQAEGAGARLVMQFSYPVNN